MTITNEVREKYIRLKAKENAIWARISPEVKALENSLRVVQAQWHKVRDQIEELIDGTDVQTCEFCAKPVFDGDKYTPGVDGGPLCEDCSPDLSDSIKQYKEVLAEDVDDWDYYNFSSRDEMAAALAEMEAEFAATGDRSMAHV